MSSGTEPPAEKAISGERAVDGSGAKGPQEGAYSLAKMLEPFGGLCWWCLQGDHEPAKCAKREEPDMSKFKLVKGSGLVTASGQTIIPKPRGRAPLGGKWDYVLGKWVKDDSPAEAAIAPAGAAMEMAQECTCEGCTGNTEQTQASESLSEAALARHRANYNNYRRKAIRALEYAAKQRARKLLFPCLKDEPLHGCTEPEKKRSTMDSEGAPQGEEKKQKMDQDHRRSVPQYRNGRVVCEHQRPRNKCIPCGGTSICEHKRIRRECKDCGGSAICPHQRNKSKCKDCGGSAVCPHGRQKSKCIPCGGASICEHKRIRIRCRECGGSGFCEHQRRKSRCVECGGTSVCEHKRIREHCHECKSSAICVHQLVKKNCLQCGGSNICEHLRIRKSCRECRARADAVAGLLSLHEMPPDAAASDLDMKASDVAAKEKESREQRAEKRRGEWRPKGTGAATKAIDDGMPSAVQSHMRPNFCGSVRKADDEPAAPCDGQPSSKEVRGDQEALRAAGGDASEKMASMAAAQVRAAAPFGKVIKSASGADVWPLHPSLLRKGFNDGWNAYQRYHKGRKVTTEEWRVARLALWHQHDREKSTAATNIARPQPPATHPPDAPFAADSLLAAAAAVAASYTHSPTPAERRIDTQTHREGDRDGQTASVAGNPPTERQIDTQTERGTDRDGQTAVVASSIPPSSAPAERERETDRQADRQANRQTAAQFLVPAWLQDVMAVDEAATLGEVMRLQHVQEADLEFFTDDALREGGIEKAITRAKLLRHIRDHFTSRM